MNRVQSRRVLVFSLLFTSVANSLGVANFNTRSFFSTRSQAVNAVRELVSWQEQIHKCEYEHLYTTFAATAEYGRSFNPKRIARFLFGCDTLTFSGSRVIHERKPDEILADYFGLPADFKSIITVSPRITNFIMDLDWYLGLDGCVPGLYVKLHLPIVHTKWDLNINECIVDAGMSFTSHPGGYMSAEPIERSELAPSVKEAFRGSTVFGDMREPLKFGKIFGRQRLIRVAELQAVLGYDFFCDTWYHFGLNVRVAAPTGNRSTAEFIFEPMVGNGHHWEFGGGLTSHVQLYQSENEKHRLALYLDANITHLFSAKQKRSFDFTKNGSLSRYILLEQIGAPASGLNIANNVAAPNQYQGRLLPAINETTLDAKISIPVQADVVLKFAYQRNGLEIDWGYNFWGRSKEKLRTRDCFPSNCFALKGDAQLYGFDQGDETPIALNATQSLAIINRGQGTTNFVAGAEFQNLNANNPVEALNSSNVALFQVTPADAAMLGINTLPVSTSDPAILLDDKAIDCDSALVPRAIAHKIFTHIGYVWDRAPEVTPYLGFGADVEWACPCVCDNSAHSQWALWVKGGLSY